MAFDRLRSRRRALLVSAVLALACGISSGCETVQPSTKRVGSFHFTGDGMYEGFQRWRDTATPEDRAVIEELIARKDLTIHIILKVGFLDETQSRGGASALASSSLAQNACFWHPKGESVPPERDWDVIYDRQLAENFEKQHGIPMPPEVGMQHEVFGHISLVLADPALPERLKADKQLEKANEREALEIENRYRKRLGFRVVPPELAGVSPL